MAPHETNPLEVPDGLVELLKNRNALEDLSQDEFDFLLLRPLWGVFVKRSLETGTVPTLSKGLFQGDFYLPQELQNGLIVAYQKLLRAKSDVSGGDVPITPKITVPKARIETYFNETYHLLVSNNLYSLRAKVRQNKGKNEDMDFDSAGLSMAVIGFTKELAEFDPEKDREGILYHSSGTVSKFVREAHKETKDDNYSPELQKVRKMVDDFVEADPFADADDPDLGEDGYGGLTTRQMLQIILGELPNTEPKFLLKHWESYLYVLGIGKVGYEEISGQGKWEPPKNVEAFRKGLMAVLDGMEEKQLVKYVSEVAFRTDQMNRSTVSLDAPVGSEDENCSLSDMIEVPNNGGLSVSDQMFLDWYLEIIRREVDQKGKHKTDLPLRERIVLGMVHEGFFTIGELYYLLEEYFGGYPASYIDHWDRFGFYGKPQPGNRNHPHSLDPYWLQFFDEEVDMMKASSIARILDFTEEGIVKIDARIKDELNKHYRKTDKETGEVIFEFRYMKYKDFYSESYAEKENYLRTKYPRPKENK